jgi:hypothetical protein
LLIVHSDVAFADIASIEGKNKQSLDQIKIGIIYCKEGQDDPFQMFKNGIFIFDNLAHHV